MKQTKFFTEQIKQLQIINRCYSESINRLYRATPTMDDLNFVNGYLDTAIVQAQDIIMIAKQQKKENTKYFDEVQPYRPFQIPTAGSPQMDEMHEHLCLITSGLINMAKAAGRTGYHRNQLLRECYNLVDAELHTIEAWHEMGYSIKQDARPYLFWNRPIEMEEGRIYTPIQFLFSADQVTK